MSRPGYKEIKVTIEIMLAYLHRNGYEAEKGTGFIRTALNHTYAYIAARQANDGRAVYIVQNHYAPNSWGLSAGQGHPCVFMGLADLMTTLMILGLAPAETRVGSVPLPAEGSSRDDG